jgi:hypothetical protein
MNNSTPSAGKGKPPRLNLTSIRGIEQSPPDGVSPFAWAALCANADAYERSLREQSRPRTFRPYRVAAAADRREAA